MPVDLHLAEALFHLLLPAMKFNMLPGHPNLSIGPVDRSAPTAAPASWTTSSAATPTGS